MSRPYPKPAPRKKKSTEIPTGVRLALRARSGGICEGCGIAPATEAHHRLYRSRGGQHVLENLLDLCGRGNHTGCHGAAHTAEGQELGWSVSSRVDPAKVPSFTKSALAYFKHDGDQRVQITVREAQQMFTDVYGVAA